MEVSPERAAVTNTGTEGAPVAHTTPPRGGANSDNVSLDFEGPESSARSRGSVASSNHGESPERDTAGKQSDKTDGGKHNGKQDKDQGPQVKDGDTTFKTRLCRNFEATGQCRYDRMCMYAHGHNELRTTEMNVKDGLTTHAVIRAYQMSTANKFGYFHNGKYYTTAVERTENNATGKAMPTPLVAGGPMMVSPMAAGAMGTRSNSGVMTASNSGPFCAPLTPQALSLPLSPQSLYCMTPPGAGAIASNYGTPMQSGLAMPQTTMSTNGMVPQWSPAAGGAAGDGGVDLFNPLMSSQQQQQQTLVPMPGQQMMYPPVQMPLPAAATTSPGSQGVSLGSAKKSLNPNSSSWDPINKGKAAAPAGDDGAEAVSPAKSPAPIVSVKVSVPVPPPTQSDDKAAAPPESSSPRANTRGATPPPAVDDVAAPKSADASPAKSEAKSAAPCEQDAKNKLHEDEGKSQDAADEGEQSVKTDGEAAEVGEDGKKKKGGDTTYKTMLCRNFEAQGKCRYDGMCMYAHGHNELRNCEMNVRDGLITRTAIRAYQSAARRMSAAGTATANMPSSAAASLAAAQSAAFAAQASSDMFCTLSGAMPQAQSPPLSFCVGPQGCSALQPPMPPSRPTGVDVCVNMAPLPSAALPLADIPPPVPASESKLNPSCSSWTPSTGTTTAAVVPEEKKLNMAPLPLPQQLVAPVPLQPLPLPMPLQATMMPQNSMTFALNNNLSANITSGAFGPVDATVPTSVLPMPLHRGSLNGGGARGSRGGSLSAAATQAAAARRASYVAANRGCTQQWYNCVPKATQKEAKEDAQPAKKPMKADPLQDRMASQSAFLMGDMTGMANASASQMAGPRPAIEGSDAFYDVGATSAISYPGSRSMSVLVPGLS